MFRFSVVMPASLTQNAGNEWAVVHRHPVVADYDLVTT